MARKLAPAHRTRDGQPIKTTDVTRAPTHPRPRTGDRVPTRACARSRACAYPDCVCEEDD